MANRILGFLKTLFARAMEEEGLIEANPIQEIKRVSEEKPCDRVYKDDEIRWIRSATEGRPDSSAGLLKTFLYTAARRSEVLNMRWQALDLDRRVCWIPAETEGNKDATLYPLEQSTKAIDDLVTAAELKRHSETQELTVQVLVGEVIQVLARERTRSSERPSITHTAEYPSDG